MFERAELWGEILLILICKQQKIYIVGSSCVFYPVVFMVLSEMVSLQHIDYMYWATPKSAEEIVAVILCFMNKFELN